MGATELSDRVDQLVTAWRLTVERVVETDSSVLAFCRREGRPVVLKVAKYRGDEWKAGESLVAFGGRGAVRVYEQSEGATLMEWASPGYSLVDMAASGADDDATAVLAATIKTMTPQSLPEGVPTIEDWGRGFDRYAASGDTQISKALLSTARKVYSELCTSQTRVRLLHGDLHHDNVLFDTERGWLAIDPKGVIGEVEYEVGAALRNPVQRPDLFAASVIIQRRVRRFSDALDLRTDRILAWAFAQAVLSAVWTIEEDSARGASQPSLHLAEALWPVVNGARQGIGDA